MRRIRLDRIDRRILQNLQADGRMTNVELAKRVGITAPPCLRRVRALEEAGLIRGYHAEVAFETLVRSWPEVREAHMLAGETDFLLKIVATDWDSYQRFLSTRLTSAPNVAHVKSAMTLRVSKAEPGVPLVDDAKAVETEDAA
jgi:DNA-binding Lrp family transcriptional regulator